MTLMLFRRDGIVLIAVITMVHYAGNRKLKFYPSDQKFDRIIKVPIGLKCNDIIYEILK